jgi:DNA repair ATPase RecN
MLTELRIRNFAVSEEAALSFGPGLNVLTGETGAGKTIVMTALGLLLGGRASREVIRTGAKEAVVEGVFELEGEAPLPEAADWLSEDNPRELLIRRVVAEGGRSRVTINDSLATVNALTRIGGALVQIYGQHEQQSLALRENRRFSIAMPVWKQNSKRTSRPTKMPARFASGSPISKGANGREPSCSKSHAFVLPNWSARPWSPARMTRSHRTAR